MQTQEAELRVLHDLGAALSLDHLVLAPPLAEPRAVLAHLRQELLVLPLAGMARVLSAKPRQRIAGGRFALRRHPALSRIDHQPPEQIPPVGSKMVGRAEHNRRRTVPSEDLGHWP